MPFYEYRCAACRHEESFLESFDAPQQKTCPKCGKKRAFKRLVSAAGFQLKGSGWYVTDFRDKDRPKKKAAAEQDGGKDGENSAGKDSAKDSAKGDKAAAQTTQSAKGDKTGAKQQKAK